LRMRNWKMQDRERI
jgi:homospermidine synthase